MRSYGYVALLLTILIANTFAAKCKVQNNILSPGQTIKHPEAECAELECLEDGSTQYLSCPTPALAAGCKDEGFENPNLPYPSCCKRVITCV